LEAAIAYWHTIKNGSIEKWENILQLYNRLLQVEYSPIAALNRTFALSKANGKLQAIKEAEKLDLKTYHLYHMLLGNLYIDIDNVKTAEHLEIALSLTKTDSDKSIIIQTINKLSKKNSLL